MIIIDITGLQSEDMDSTLEVIRALHNKAIYYNTLYYVSADDEELQNLYEKEIDV